MSNLLILNTFNFSRFPKMHLGCVWVRVQIINLALELARYPMGIGVKRDLYRAVPHLIGDIPYIVAFRQSDCCV